MLVHYDYKIIPKSSKEQNYCNNKLEDTLM